MRRFPRRTVLAGVLLVLTFYYFLSVQGVLRVLALGVLDTILFLLLVLSFVEVLAWNNTYRHGRCHTHSPSHLATVHAYE